VSVVTIFLNAERFLREAIDSVLQQDFYDFELILVDDGSADRSSEIANEYVRLRDGQVRYLEHEGHANRGMSASRNLGVAAARGEFIAFIDADDVWKPSKLSEQVALMDEYPELGMSCGAVRYWNSWAGGRDALIPTGHRQDVVVDPPAALLSVYPLGTAKAPCPSDLLIRKDVLCRIGAFEEHFTGPRQMYEDQGMLAKLYLAAPVYFSSRVWLDYRQHPDSCVASVTRQGAYHEVRLYFLTWFERYLASLAHLSDPQIATALKRAFRPYRQPKLNAVLTLAGSAKRSIGRVRRRIRSGVRNFSARSFAR
jgi:glycosyltransferase involved in cell wall biosynthesis